MLFLYFYWLIKRRDKEMAKTNDLRRKSFGFNVPLNSHDLFIYKAWHIASVINSFAFWFIKE